jgi:pimeloyl-ACP methyl ester carboxylesterase
VSLERLDTGTGRPVTVFAHGLAGGIPDTQPLGSAVAGTRVFFQFRGHGRSDAPPGDWTFQSLADDLDHVSTDAGATRAVGVSLGAGALCRLLAESPDRYERLVFFLPAALDTAPRAESRERYATLLTALGTGDPERVVAVLTDDVPAEQAAAHAARAYLRQRATALLEAPPSARLADVITGAPCSDPAPLGKVRVPALVLAARDEPRHPVPVAEQLAAALGSATLHVYDRPYPLWTARADVRTRISGFLNAA